MMEKSIKPVLLGSVAVLSWSTVATAFKIALNNLTVYEMVLVASLTALAVFTVWMTVTRSWGVLKHISASSLSRLAILGLIIPVYYLVLFKAYDYLPAQIAQPINYIWPIILTVMLALFAHKSIPVSKYIGMAVSLAGVVMISVGGKGITGTVSVAGISLAVLSAVLWALYWIVNDSLKDKVSEGVALFLTFLFGVDYLLIGSIFIPVSGFGMEALLSGAYIGAFEMGIPFICFGLAIRETENPALINQMCYLAPFLSLFFITMVLGEPIMPTTYMGLVLIIGGLVYNQYFAGREKALIKR